jgi:hypothetical protein
MDPFTGPRPSPIFWQAQMKKIVIALFILGMGSAGVMASQQDIWHRIYHHLRHFGHKVKNTFDWHEHR